VAALTPKLSLGTSLAAFRQVRKIARSAKSGRPMIVLDAVQQDRARRLKQHLLVVAVEPPDCEAT
jgi:hypothetical protein